MTYLKVKWDHSNPEYPTLLYSELDDERWEVRKIEFFTDGRVGLACEGLRIGRTKLGIEPVPSIAEIASDPVFTPETISADEFEAHWKRVRPPQ